MSVRRITIIVMALAVVGLVGWDIYAVLAQEPGEGGTISEVLRDFSIDWWTIPYLGCVLIAHWFLTNPKIEGKGFMWSLPRIGYATIPVLAFDVIFLIAEIERSYWLLPIPVLYGGVIGYLFWASLTGKSSEGA